MVSAMLDEKDKDRAMRDYQRLLCGILTTPKAKPEPVKREPKIAPREVVMAAAQAFARNEIDRSELMRRITPEPSQLPAIYAPDWITQTS
jgi:hypothetical protein